MIPLCRTYRLEMDPDYKLPKSDIDGVTDPENVEVDSEDVELLVKEAEDPLPEEDASEER